MRPPRSNLRPDSESLENSVQNMSPPCIEVPSKESLVWSNPSNRKIEDRSANIKISLKHKKFILKIFDFLFNNQA